RFVPRQTILSGMQSACDTRSSAANTYLLVRASSKPDARRWSLPVLRGRECSGPFEEPTRSWLYAAAISMATLKITGRHVGQLNFNLQVAHPSDGGAIVASPGAHNQRTHTVLCTPA